jgi:hypothetical protein
MVFIPNQWGGLRLLLSRANGGFRALGIDGIERVDCFRLLMVFSSGTSVKRTLISPSS